MPDSFEITSSLNNVEVQLKGIPFPIDEIEEIQWIVDSSSLEQNTDITFTIQDISCFSDTSRHFSNGVLSKIDESIVSSEIHTSALSSSSDITAPIIDLLRFNNKAILDQDYISSTPQLSATLIDMESGISQWSIRLFNAENDAILRTIPTQNIQPTVNTYMLEYEFEEQLPEGDLYLTLTTYDVAGNETELTSPFFKVTHSQQLKNAVFGPVPFNPNDHEGKFNYELTQPADIDIYIYSISGEEVWHFSASNGSLLGGSIGFNEVLWDGHNYYGDLLGNGPYIAYLVANFEDTKSVKKIKIMVLK